MSSNILVPGIMQIGAGASLCLPDVLAQMGLSKPLFITGPVVTKYGYLKRVTDTLEAANINYGVFNDVPNDPTTATVTAALAALGEGDYDCVVGLGGGSPMDTAKAVSLLAVKGGAVRDYKAPINNSVPGLPIIAIPTTAGTGSEATKVTIITDAESDEKMLLMGRAFMPVAALVDFEMTLTMPYRLTADTGIDSMTHAMEAYVSRKANLFSDALALAAMKIIYKNIRKVCEDLSNREAREAMMLGACQAGMAFSNASVALVHGMSRPIGANFHVPHGLSNAMLLPAVTAFSVPHCVERYADCARAMEMVPADCDDATANTVLLAELRRLNQELEVPSPEQYGIDRQRFMDLLPTMAEQAIASGSPGNNPVIPDSDQIIAIYKEIFSNVC
ncbi:iron-containing alcohol dehydrogenase [Dasania sp. GY-MA-18]|uniref:Iron-containing alcohol dehydrogenase n=1 Tax=Dasania phycosphaerae TaxID=2950436 RepID=A0A9J6RLU3_9GAMM|nr:MULTISPECIES: iron-containing alcohol dehydrogenase [Dasania]MCR8922850.1 iron-containing alcohol dehydrogenase [Dasania sp. GY-MA-18]MCZ0865281.1 iron-containing alcohol dehydrogenase [Dasania phycosphaerae]MCZ0869006.1 iron-containing alcohol dehydrogenase [Dasania phycosphaerae]